METKRKVHFLIDALLLLQHTAVVATNVTQPCENSGSLVLLVVVLVYGG